MMALSFISKCSNTSVTASASSSSLLSCLRRSNVRAQQQHGWRRRRYYDTSSLLMKNQYEQSTMRYYWTSLSSSSSHHLAVETTASITLGASWRRRRSAAEEHGRCISNNKSRRMLLSTSSTTLESNNNNNKTDDSTNASSSSSSLRVIEFSACSSKRPRSSSSGSSSSGSNKQQDQKLNHHHHHHNGATVFISDKTTGQWKKQDSSVLLLLHDGNADGAEQQLQPHQQPSLALSFSISSWNDFFFHHVIRHFLPAHYPDSVGTGYARFSIYAFGASMAGSAAMVLSTQTLLLAVGVVGAQTTTATSSIMAGALNWVVKDGIGQVGGVIFASRMGQSRRFDDNPKRWRMVAAASLDAASFMEILSPIVWPFLVLPVACTANVLKNIGFLTASASRAALHQSLARAGNLADVTAKSGSQSMAAGLLGTTLGIILSTTVLNQDPQLFILGFVVLSFFHQVGNYSSLQHVGLNHFNRHRLHLVLHHYLQQQQQQAKGDNMQHQDQNGDNIKNSDKITILTPDQVAHCEVYFPLMREDDADTWLSIACGLSHIAPGGPRELTRLLDILSDESYLINISSSRDKQRQGQRVYLTFLEGASGEDLIKGCLHAYLIRHELDFNNNSQYKDDDNVDTAEAAAQSFHCIKSTLAETNRRFPQLLQGLHDCQWKTTTDVTNIESSTGFRLTVNKSLPTSTNT